MDRLAGRAEEGTDACDPRARRWGFPFYHIYGLDGEARGSGVSDGYHVELVSVRMDYE